VTLTEVAPFLLLFGLFTPLAYGGVCALMVVAWLTNHLRNGFFLNTSTEGYEYVATVAIVSITLGTLGAGEWSLDDALDLFFYNDLAQSLAITAILGLVGRWPSRRFWRPPKTTRAERTEEDGRGSSSTTSQRLTTSPQSTISAEVADRGARALALGCGSPLLCAIAGTGPPGARSASRPRGQRRRGQTATSPLVFRATLYPHT
jgi:hypothetical protein